MYINKSFLIPELTGFFFVDILKWRSLSCVTAVWADCKAAIRDWGLFIVVFLLTDDGRESSQRNNRMACLRSVQLLTESHLIYLMWFCEQRLVLQQRRWKGSPPPLQWEDCAGGQVSGDLWEQACRKPIWAGNGEEFMRAVLEWIETCRRRFVFRSLTDGNGRRWWRGRRWPLAPLSWSLTADRMNLCLTAGGRQQSEPAVTRLSLQTLKVR